MKLGNIRQDYQLGGLHENDINSDPIALFEEWFNQAIKSEVKEVNAMTLATADEDGNPSARIVLLKYFDQDGFVFFTNYDSRKGKEIKSRPKAALLFFWKELERQVRIEGIIENTTIQESDLYFNERNLESRISAIISPQSKVVPSRDFLQAAWDKLKSKQDTKYFQRPDNWGGFRLKPISIEFWQGRTNRLHDRILFQAKGSDWKISRLAP